MQFFDQKLEKYFNFCFNEYRKLVKYSITLRDTKKVFTNRVTKIPSAFCTALDNKDETKIGEQMRKQYGFKGSL